MKNLTDFRKTVETGVDPRLNTVCLHESKLDLIINGNERLALQMKATVGFRLNCKSTVECNAMRVGYVFESRFSAGKI